MEEYVTFKAENQKFGISTEYVEKILNSFSISKIPGSKNFVEGVINYQENIIPIINLKKLFDMSDSKADSGSIIIVRKGDGRAGIIIDEVDDIEESDNNDDCMHMQNRHIEKIKILNGTITSILSPNVINSVE